MATKDGTNTPGQVWRRGSPDDRTNAPRRTGTVFWPIVLLLACAPGSDDVTFRIDTHAFHDAEWSAPVNLGAAVNSTANDQNATLSPDELSLYFVSNRPGGAGGTDLWVSRRACVACPWETAQNAAAVNSAGGEGGPCLSLDGHLLFFHSTRPGGHGMNDLWVSRRADSRDDFAWGPPENLGPGVNTEINEFAPEFLEGGEPGAVNLYFSRGVTGTLQDIYRASVARDGASRGVAQLVPELSDPDANDAAPTVRTDGRELLFWSNRAGGPGGADIWRATRRVPSGPWAAPLPLEALNTEFDDQRPNLSADGRTLLFDSDRPTGAGGQDIWISTRRNGT